jgi:hypothetical protein
MKNILMIVALSILAFSCGISKDYYTESISTDTTTVVVVKNTDLLPYQDPDRLTGSVSPRAEETSPYIGSQGPNGTNNTILEPMRSRSTRSYNSHPTNYNSGGGDRGSNRTATPGNNRY